jgi:bifunctional non-homologous end joining protein LigD
MRRAAFPDWLDPMAPTLTHERFSGPEWVFERKFDGIRLLAYRRGRQVRLLSRNRLPQHHPAIAAALLALPVHEVILDGEVAWRGGSAYHVFDILWLDGEQVARRPLQDRRELLARLPLAAPLQRVAEITGPKPWERACDEGWEGVVAKRRDAPYEHGRSPHWLKMKCETTQELVIGGFTDPRGARVGLGALLVGYYDGDDFVFAGKVGTGFDATLLRALRARLNRAEMRTVPFTRSVGLPRKGAHWVRPEIVVQVAFIEWTAYGKLRHSRLVGLREDKSPREVVRETS